VEEAEGKWRLENAAPISWKGQKVENDVRITGSPFSLLHFPVHFKRGRTDTGMMTLSGCNYSILYTGILYVV